MKIENRKLKIAAGFSLTEVMMAAGILAIGFMLIATLFPVGVKLISIATERTVAAVTADEAFAKIRIYGMDPCNLAAMATDELYDFAYVSGVVMDPCEFLYPSADLPDEQRSYNWSALCRKIADPCNSVQVTVFISRKAGAAAKFPDPANLASDIDYPKPIRISRFDIDYLPDVFVNEIYIHTDDTELAKYVVEGAMIVDNRTGRLMTVLSREPVGGVVILEPDHRRLILAEAVEEDSLGDSFWVIPPARGGGRNPCIGVFQRVISF